MSSTRSPPYYRITLLNRGFEQRISVFKLLSVLSNGSQRRMLVSAPWTTLRLPSIT